MMVKLEINNSISRISNLTFDQFEQLKKILSYKIDDKSAYFSKSFHNKRRYLLDKKGNFPTGLLPYVLGYIKTSNLLPFTVDKRKKPNNIIQGINLQSLEQARKEQLEAVKTCLMNNRGTVVMPTGSGKSYTMALLVNQLKVKTLIVVPNLCLKNQLKEVFLNYFGHLDNITVENTDSPALLKPSNYDCLIIDEAHHVATKTYQKLNKKYWQNIYYRFFFTATPFRTKDEEQILMESVSGQVIYNLPYLTCVYSGYIVSVEAYYIELPKTKSEGYTYSEVYADLVVNNDVRNEIISKLLINLNNANISTLCLIKEIKHGEILSNKTNIPFVSGKEGNFKRLIDDFNSRGSSGLIGTTGVLGEGVDTRPTEFIVIAGLGRSKGQFMQQCGRGFRKFGEKRSCKIIIFKDNSHKWTKSHYLQQVKYLKEEYGVIPARLDLK